MARFWEFQQLSDEWRGTSFFDEVPLPPDNNKSNKKLFIGGLAALYKEPDPLKEHGITHVLSVLDFDIGDALKGIKNHLHIRIDDHHEENLLPFFEKTNTFIEQGGNVFVHCAMGVSRSASVVCAWLMWKFGLSRDEALERVRLGRKRCRPNFGFWEQLGVYERVLKCGTKEDREEVVRRWGGGSIRLRSCDG